MRLALVACLAAGLGACSTQGLLNSGSGVWADLTEQPAVPAGVEREYQAAVERMVAGDDAAAISRLQAFIEKHPEYPGAYVNLAIVLDRLISESADGSSSELLEKAIREHPDLERDIRELYATAMIASDVSTSSRCWCRVRPPPAS